MRYVKARYERNRRDLIYRIYITDGLKSLAGIGVRYYDCIKRDSKERTEQEIITSIKDKLRICGKEK